MIQILVVDPGNIAGGLIADPPSESKYNHLSRPISASQFDFTWQAEWLWGDGTSNHVHDTAAAGIWRPKDANHFYENDDAAPIPCIGKYTNDIEGIYDLIARAEAGETESNRMMTAAIFIGQGGTQSEKLEQVTISAELGARTADCLTPCWAARSCDEKAPKKSAKRALTRPLLRL